MANIAFLTVGLLSAPYYDPQITELGNLLDPIADAAMSSRGFIALSRLEEKTANHDWGKVVLPLMFQKKEFEMRVLSILSLWESIEAVFAFSYYGLHGKTLSRRKDWFVSTEYPNYVAWWVSDEHTPTWQEACGCYAKLHQSGSTAEAFNFKQVFDEKGRKVELDQNVIKQITKNAG